MVVVFVATVVISVVAVTLLQVCTAAIAVAVGVDLSFAVVLSGLVKRGDMLVVVVLFCLLCSFFLKKRTLLLPLNFDIMLVEYFSKVQLEWRVDLEFFLPSLLVSFLYCPEHRNIYFLVVHE